MAVLFCFTLSAQDYGNAVPDTSGNPLSDEDVQSIIMLKTILNDKPAYELYRTENMWTFLKLETSTGKIWQVQYAVGDGDAFETVLSDVSLAFDGVEINGRFRLYPIISFYWIHLPVVFIRYSGLMSRRIGWWFRFIDIERLFKYLSQKSM